ncbi:MAG: condensation domain-containing protein [Clostridiaceae bacterium]
MKMKAKFGDIKYSYDGELNDFFKNFNKLAVMFTKYNSEFLGKMYETIPPNLSSYFKNVNNLFDEFWHIKKPDVENLPDDPNILHANGHDIYNYVARYGLTNHQIQAVMKLDGHLDFDRLIQAVRLTIDAQPVFGCRFVENEPPYWKRLDNIDQVEFCSMEEPENSDEAIKNFIESPMDMDKDPMLKVKLIRTSQYDTLCIKNNHTCCDGAGIKEYIQLLSEIYNIIEQDGVFTPSPVKRSRKDQDILFNELGISNPEKEWKPGSEITRATWPFPWTTMQSDRFHILFCRLPEGQLDEITRYAKANKVTINDLVLAAYYRAMAQLGPTVYSEPMEISFTIDLRRYLPGNKTEAIRNFSGSEITRLALIPDESFRDTLSRIIPVMNKIKNNRPGLQSAIGLERIEKMAFKDSLTYYKAVSLWHCSCGNKCAPALSNVGVFSDTLVKFGDKTVTDAYIVPLVVRAPGLLLMVSTYNGVMTLASGIYEASVPRRNIRTLLNKISSELVEGCRL